MRELNVAKSFAGFLFGTFTAGHPCMAQTALDIGTSLGSRFS